MAKKRTKPKAKRSPAVAKQPAEEAINEVSSPKPVAISKTLPPKVCRLCETKDGPFLNIFGGEKNTAKKIDDLMPFEIAENDELPHNVCFRCSAKVEELHEFVQKCIKTQNNLGNVMGIPLVLKSKKNRSLWEQKLNRSDITNDDICNAVVKKAIEEMQSQKLTPAKTVVPGAVNATTNGEKSCNKPSPKITTTKENSSNRTSITATAADKSFSQPKAKPVTTKTVRSEPESFLSLVSKEDAKIVAVKTEIIEDDECELSLNPPKTDNIPSTKSLRSSNSDTVPQSFVSPVNNENVAKGRNSKDSNISDQDKCKNNSSANTIKNNVDTEKTPTTPKPFNIMDHVSMIKVNGVGVLFQCKMCNRNFLKKNVVLSHWCAKNGGPKEDFTKTLPPPDPPRVPNIKYINTNTGDSMKKQILGSKVTVEKDMSKSEDCSISKSKEENTMNRPKPKMGPASKVKRPPDNSLPAVGMVVSPRVPTPPAKNDSVHTPGQISATLGNCRYKVVAGPNNTFHLVETERIQNETTHNQNASKKRKMNENNEKPIESDGNVQKEKVFKQYAPKKRKTNEDNEMPIKMNVPKTSGYPAERPVQKVASAKDAQQPSVSQPYPVGLIKNVPHAGVDSAAAHPTPFTTSAQKKQSYTIVQTGHPNKLLISAKPQQPVQEPVKKRQKKKAFVQQGSEPVQPFSITLEENQPKDSGDFFTFINVDPLLQPSYVLPTDTLLQESQISTSSSSQNVLILGGNPSNNGIYSCNMCTEKFNREKKLLAHIQSHYNKMDEDDTRRSDKLNRKRGKK